ncbi:hypothetical protein EPI10_014045 [Gossypium australe]|uniref:Uncharacterized protein n=1 Tax=Gossypium australe TaxID=47621 RepID=A0A5B6UQ81_9ROSI|nr:hypothetical protein EPI10_014045 [Gossypium australe]
MEPHIFSARASLSLQHVPYLRTDSGGRRKHGQSKGKSKTRYVIEHVSDVAWWSGARHGRAASGARGLAAGGAIAARVFF